VGIRSVRIASPDVLPMSARSILLRSKRPFKVTMIGVPAMFPLLYSHNLSSIRPGQLLEQFFKAAMPGFRE
jgi:hypothetical protein